MGKISKIESQIKLTDKWVRYGGDSLLVPQTFFIQRQGTTPFFNVVTVQLDEEDSDLFSYGQCHIDISTFTDLSDVKSYYGLVDTVPEELLVQKICEYYECEELGGSLDFSHINDLGRILRTFEIAE